MMCRLTAFDKGRMIARIMASWQGGGWQKSLARAVNDPKTLLQMLNLDLNQLPALQLAARDFPLRVPLGFIRRMQPGDSRDPLLLQVLPRAEELQAVDGFQCDPLQEQESMVTPGLLHKYHGRVLLTLTGACAIHCRYCFRRHFPYTDANPLGEHLQQALDYIATSPDIEEVILSGGDPLSLSESRLYILSQGLNRIKHVKRLRIHTRLPIVLPERVDQAFLQWLEQVRATVIMVVHSNHANEIDADVMQALDKLRQYNVTLLNQAVLLRGVNDSVEALAELSKRLFTSGVLPYYLHTLDRVQGAAHFETDETQAQDLIRQLRKMLPGYLVPLLVREEAGGEFKQPL